MNIPPLIASIALFLELSALLAGGLYLFWQHEQRDHLAEMDGRILTTLSAVENSYAMVSRTLYAALLNRPLTLQLLHDGLHAADAPDEQGLLRGQLYRHLYNTYGKLRQDGLRQIHFHQPDGRSYLRMHRPERSGDSLIEFRPLVREALARKAPLQGFESGSLFHGFRYIYPLYLKEEFLGTVEVGLSFETFRKEMLKVLSDHNFMLLLRADHLSALGSLEHDIYRPSPLGQRYLIEAIDTDEQRLLPQAVVEAPLDEVRHVLPEYAARIDSGMNKGEPFSVLLQVAPLDFRAMIFEPVREIDGRLAGYILAIAPARDLNDYARMLLLILVVGLSLIAGVVWMRHRQSIARLSLREEQERLRTVTDTMVEGLFMQDQDGRITYANPAMHRILGYAPSDLLGRIAHDLIHVHDQSGHALPIEQCPIRLKTMQGEIFHGADEFFRAADGTLLPVEVTSAPIIQRRRTVGSVTVFRDITERKKAEQALQAARISAENMARLKSEFLANVSHEIRTSLNGVLSMLRLALDTKLTAEQREYLQIAFSSGDTLLALLNDIFDLSNMEAGRIQVEATEFDLYLAVEDVARLFAAKAQEKGIELTVFVDPSLPRWVIGDPVRLRQVITNLTSTAIKFTERGEVIIHARAEQEDENFVHVRFEVRDTGIGISSEAQARIFEAFGQADTFSGTGLALTLSKGLVKLMGGHLDLQSEVGRGSIFGFTLLMAKAKCNERSAGQNGSDRR